MLGIPRIVRIMAAGLMVAHLSALAGPVHAAASGPVAEQKAAPGIVLDAAPGDGQGGRPGGKPDKGPDGGSGDIYRLPAVTVTADKRLTEVQKTPIALTVMTEQTLSDRNIRTMHDVLNQVPNLQVSSWMSGINWATFRGAMSIAATGASPLVMYVDGVPVDTFYNLDATLLDVERIEILRGPQSAIYGKNALGGVINIISKKPDNTWRGKIFGHAESYDGWGGGATISGPVKEDTLYFSLAASHDYKGGWMDSVNTAGGNKEREERVKGQLRFTPTERAEFALHMDYTAIRDGYYPYTLGNHYSERSLAGPHDRDQSDFLNTALTAKLDFDAATFESITTLRREDCKSRLYGEEWMAKMGVFGVGMNGENRKKTEATQEFRLRSPDGATGFSWLLGTYASYSDYQWYDGFQEYHYYMVPGVAEDSRMEQSFRQYTTEFAPFAQVVLPVTDAFKVTAGLRWHLTHRKASFDFRPDAKLQAAPGIINGLGIPGVHMDPINPMKTRASDSWNELLPKLNLTYDITDDHMVYAGVSRSFVPGGYNYATTTSSNFTYDSQKAWNYEIGAKTSWLDKRLNINLALFYSMFDDLQIMQFDPARKTYTAHNAGSATSYGAELDVMARLARGLDAQVSVGYTHARYDDYTYVGATGAEVYDDHRIEFTPEYTLNASLTYRHDNGLFAMGAVRYVSKIYWEAKNKDYRDPVTTVDAKIGYEGEHFEAYLYGKNIFGERYLTYFTPITQLAMVAPPQTFGVEFAYKF